MKALGDFIVHQLLQRWHDPRIAAIIGSAAGLVVYLSLAVGGNKAPSDPLVICTGLLAVLACGVVWKIQHYIPKTDPKKIGVLVALGSEDDSEAKRIHEDFVSELRSLLESDKACAQFHVIELHGYNAKDVLKPERAIEVLGRAKGHLMFFGSAKRRLVGGEEVHLLTLNTLVRHAAVPKEASENFSKELNEILPRRLQVSVDGDTLSFEATSKWISLGAKFAVGVAVGFGGNLPFAESLFLDVERQLKGTGRDAAFLQPLARNVTKHLELVYRAWMQSLGHAYFMRRAISTLRMSHEISEKLIARNPADAGAHFHHALSTFMLTRNIAAARQLLLRAMKTGDQTTGYYGLAFLLAYEGNLDKAHAEYRKAFRIPSSNPTVPIQCEEFIEKLIAEEPTKIHLRFCTALINYNAKEDFDAAERDFNLFLAWPGSHEFPSARNKAEHLLAKCAARKTNPARQLEESSELRLASAREAHTSADRG